MKLFLAGATGAIGRRLVPLLAGAGHEVTGMSRAPERASDIRAAGAEPVVADALDAEALSAAVAAAAPDAVIHELTSIPQRIRPRRVRRDFALNDRLRSEGTANLVAAARAAGVRRIVAQSIAFSYAPGPPGTLHGEEDPLLASDDAPPPYRRSAQAVRDLERAVLDAGGLVLRYGYFYGPGTAFAREGSTGEDVLRRRLPIVGDGGGVWSFIHIDDAAGATLAALERGAPGAYNIVDDDPAPVREWLPELARALGAPGPRRVPAALARVAAGSYGVRVMTQAQGASNAKARRELGWSPRFASWREGFREGLS
jgi:nucleoside-diphosphate-sugar epimerase